MNIHKYNKNLHFKLLNLSLLSVYLYVMLEWIFFVTKPSFMSTMSAFQKIVVLFSASFLFGFPVMIFVFIIWGLSRIFNKASSEIRIISFGVLIPSIICACLAYILIDNFTYTVFGFGVVSSFGIWRLVYSMLFIGLIAVFYKKNYKFVINSGSNFIFPRYILLFFSVFSAIAFLYQLLSSNNITRDDLYLSSSNYPNILLIGLDGINAENTSVYGYPRNTTPNITKMSQNALIIDNAFSNSGNTHGSLTSMLTGKLPTDTRVLYPPNILIGKDAYQHLPGILKQLGYYTVQITMPHFGDAYTINIKEGFDVANFRSEKKLPLISNVGTLCGGSGTYFSTTIIERIINRVFHVTYIQKMENPYEMVTNPTTQITEEKRLETLLTYLENTDEPIFAHVHFLGTHGPTFEPKEQIYSLGKEQNQSWMIDFYDDAILNIDKLIGELFGYLQENQKFNNSIVILYSDHGMNWNSLERVPLIFWFPEFFHVGHIKENIQLIDIAPTILDYLSVPIPSWMQGTSVLVDNLNSSREIISADVRTDLVRNINGKGWVIDETKSKPPFYQLGVIHLIVCDRWFTLNLRTMTLTHGDVPDSTTVCNETEYPLPEEALELILQNLDEAEYDISSIPSDNPIISALSIEPVFINENVIIDESVYWDYPSYGWNPLIAHGFGKWNGKQSPNNLEAFLESYDEGYRNFEVDIMMSSDGIPIAAHDRKEWDYYGLMGVFSEYSAEQFLATKFDGVGTTMAGEQVLELVNEYPEIRIILDVKVDDQVAAIGWFLDRLPESQWPRVLTTIRNEKQIVNLLEKYPSYRGVFLQLSSWRDDLSFSDEEARDIILKYNLTGVFTWVNELDYSLDYISNNAMRRRWTPKLEHYMRESDKAMIWHTTDDPDLIEIRRSSGGAIISNTATP